MNLFLDWRDRGTACALKWGMLAEKLKVNVNFPWVLLMSKCIQESRCTFKQNYMPLKLMYFKTCNSAMDYTAGPFGSTDSLDNCAEMNRWMKVWILPQTAFVKKKVFLQWMFWKSKKSLSINCFHQMNKVIWLKKEKKSQNP